MCDFLILINTNLHSIYRTVYNNLLQIIEQHGARVFSTLVRDESLNSGPRNLASETIDTSLYHMVLM